jgi:hypothetical protein
MFNDTKSAFLSKINWTQAVSLAAMALAFFGIDVPYDVKAALIAGIGAATTVVTWILRTWFTTKLTHASAAK